MDSVLEQRTHVLGRLDASELPLSERQARWQEVTARLLVPLGIWSMTETVNGSIGAVESAGVTVCTVRATAHSAVRTEDLAGCDQTRCVKFAVPLRRRVTVSQGSRRATLRPGEICLYRTSRPYVVESDAPLDMAIVMVPEAAVPLSSRHLDDLAALPLRGGLVPAIRASLLRAGQGGLSERERDLAMDRLGEVVTRPDRDDGDLVRRYARVRTRARDVVARRLSEPWLSPDYLADSLGISRRTLYEAFAADGATVAASIRHMRLDRARDLLMREGAALSVSDAAAECGFVSVAHFSRLFRAEFGVPPSRVAEM